MRAVIQRVSEAKVEVDQNVTGQIQQGLVILLGIEHEDTEEDLDWLLGKILRMRIFEDNDGKMNRSVQDIDGELLIVSQFTLHASTKKGNRPSFIQAANPDLAKKLYEKFLAKAEQLLSNKIQAGIFASDMQVSLINDGPVTLIIDSKQRW